MRRERSESAAAYDSPWPCDALPTVQQGSCCAPMTGSSLPALLRKVAAERLGVIPDEIAAGHCVALSRPNELADMLIGYTPSAR